jgi:hypothetical protein
VVDASAAGPGAGRETPVLGPALAAGQWFRAQVSNDQASGADRHFLGS